MNQEYKIPSSFEAPNDHPRGDSIEQYFLDNIEIVQKAQDSITQMRSHMLNTYYVSPSEAKSNKILNPVRRLIGTEVRPTELVLTESMLLDREGVIGGSLFTEEVPGVECKFFYFDDSWFFHQKVKSDQDNALSSTFRYQLTDSGVVKAKGAQLEPLDIVEFNNFVNSVQYYHYLVSTRLYQVQ